MKVCCIDQASGRALVSANIISATSTELDLRFCQQVYVHISPRLRWYGVFRVQGTIHHQPCRSQPKPLLCSIPKPKTSHLRRGTPGGGDEKPEQAYRPRTTEAGDGFAPFVTTLVRQQSHYCHAHNKYANRCDTLKARQITHTLYSLHRTKRKHQRACAGHEGEASDSYQKYRMPPSHCGK